MIATAGGPAEGLTPSARDMLAIPIIEILDETNADVEWGMVENSIKDIVHSLKPDEYLKGQFTARSVIAAFHFRFCNIPPFCGPVGR